MSFAQWLKNLFSRKKKQDQWDGMYNTSSRKPDDLSLDPKNDPWRT